MKTLTNAIAVLVPALALSASGQTTAPKPPTDAAAANIAKTPTLYVVGYAHLDTQWRWTYVDTIRDYIPNTLRQNFALLDKYPDYIFNFSGSRRYRMMEEYYPDDFEKLKRYVAAGTWFPCGSSVDENDANVPSAESLVRHVLYGNKYFRNTFGTASDEYMLPDCFGFPAALPSVLAHCGLKGFSTQKLTWNACIPIPFKVGVWNGPDGKGIVAALDPGAYVGEVRDNLAKSDGWKARIENNGKLSGVFADYHYFGTGDEGGAPKESSVAMVQESVRTDGPIKVVSSQADWLFDAITPEMRAQLPVYAGELELTEHSAGAITSQAYMKRWNRKNELLADAAERASVAAWWLGLRDYPAQRLEDAWYLVLGSQMHDILPGTSLPRAYEFSWNDEVIAANQFASVLADGASAVIGQMNTTAPKGASGAPIVLFNPLSFVREDVVEIDLPATADAKGAAATDSVGRPVPAQLLSVANGIARVALLAQVQGLGFAAFNVSLSAASAPSASLRVTERELENEVYLVKLDDNGDVASITDKRTKRELLAAPLRIGLHYENPRQWPAWNQDWADRQKPAQSFAASPRFKVIENGPARVAIDVTREAEGSTFTERIRLAGGGASERIEFDTDIDWRTRERSVRVTFPLVVSNPKATYDLQTGVLERGNGHEKQFEYGFQQWFDLTDAKGDYGVAVMCDSKYGADKPNDNTVRLTLLHTPGTRGGYPDQGSQDLGRHHVLYALNGHPSDWSAGSAAQQAMRLNQPILPFATPAHEGPLGRSFTLGNVSDPNVVITALKKAEASSDVVLRLRNLADKPAKRVRVTLANRLESVREVDGQERPLGAATLDKGELVTDIGPYALKAFAVTLAPPPSSRATARSSASVVLPFDTDVASTNAQRADGAFDDQGAALPAEQFPTSIAWSGASFALGSTKDGAKNAVACNGQSVSLPSGDFDRLYVLAAANDDVSATLDINGTPTPWSVQSWNGMVGQWDRRLWGEIAKDGAPRGDIVGLEPGFVKRDPIGWFCSHHHTREGDAIYSYCYLFAYSFPLPKDATTISLPKDPRIKVLATTVANAGPQATPAAPFFDTLSDHVQDAPRIVVDGKVGGGVSLRDAAQVSIEPGLYWREGAIRYTVDGSPPNVFSPVYAGPIDVAGTTTISAAVVGRDNRIGPAVTSTLDINDITPPRVLAVSGLGRTRTIDLTVSERLDPGMVHATNFGLTPKIEITAADIDQSARHVRLTLAEPLEEGRSYNLSLRDLRDGSPARNPMAAVIVNLKAAAPVYRLAAVTSEMRGTTIKDVAGLPTRGSDSWTINAFVRSTQEPKNRTVIFGFGRCNSDNREGMGRYFCKFANGLQLWIHNRDVATRAALDVDRWQMLTATYDGQALRVFKDGERVGERAVTLADDENQINIAPLDPWEHRRQFEGDIRDFTIWNAALSEDAIRLLRESMPQ